MISQDFGFIVKRRPYMKHIGYAMETDTKRAFFLPINPTPINEWSHLKNGFAQYVSELLP